MERVTAGVNQHHRLRCSGIPAQLISLFHHQEDNLARAHSEILRLRPQDANHLCRE